MSEIVDALQDVEGAVRRVEKAIKDKWGTPQWMLAALIGFFLWSLPGVIWHAKWRYALSYHVTSDKIIIADHPHDCAFLAAPLGEKYCHYEKNVDTSTEKICPAGYALTPSQDSCYDGSYPFGKGATVNPQEKIASLYISWIRKED